MRHDRVKVFELRKEGKTYREIEKLTGVSRSTLCEWFRNEEWSRHIKYSNTKKHTNISKERIEKLNEGRRLVLERKYKQVEKEAEEEFKTYIYNPLFTAGLMLYAGEGDKRNRHVIKLTNSEFYLHLVFIRFSEDFLKVKKETIKIWLLLYPDHNIEECTEVWSKMLKIKKLNFTKPQVIQGRSSGKRKLQYGVGNSTISSTSLKKKILKWLELYKLTLN